MAICGGNKRVRLVVACSLAILAVLVGWPASAQAQTCQPNQFVDRTAPGADRELTWTFNFVNDPEHCMQVRVGQTMVWRPLAGEGFETHPLVGRVTTDVPNNPINADLPTDPSYAVTFGTAGTFEYFCTNHPSTMLGAIKVVAAPAAPAMSPWLVVALMALLLASGWVVIRREAAPARASGET